MGSGFKKQARRFPLYPLSPSTFFALIVRWLAVAPPLRHCRLSSRYTPGSLGLRLLYLYPVRFLSLYPSHLHPLPLPLHLSLPLPRLHLSLPPPRLQRKEVLNLSQCPTLLSCLLGLYLYLLLVVNLVLLVCRLVVSSSLVLSYLVLFYCLFL